jgi:hypothetical protein
MPRPLGTITRSAVQRLSDKIGGGRADDIFFSARPGAGTYVVMRTGWYTIHLLGAGGAGGVAVRANTNIYARATGGGSGAYLRKRVFLTEGQTLPYNVGAGGTCEAVAVSYSANSSSTSGTSGGATSLTLPDSTALNAPGGGGGQARTDNDTNANNGAYQNGGSGGGTPTGGDVNLPGSKGGNVTNTVAQDGTNGLSDGGAGGSGVFISATRGGVSGGGGAPGQLGGNGGSGVHSAISTGIRPQKGGLGAGGGGAMHEGTPTSIVARGAGGPGGDGAIMIVSEI